MSLHVAALILAAGASRRYGSRNKLTERFAGKALVAHSVDAALEAGLGPVHVVTGCEPDAVRDALSGRNISFVHHAAYEQGMGSSLAAGVRSFGEFDGLSIMLGDMPAIRATHVRGVVEAFANHYAQDGAETICVASFEGRRGHPVVFGQAHQAALARLAGDQGAKTLLEAAADRVIEVSMSDDGILRDIDRATDWPSPVTD